MSVLLWIRRKGVAGSVIPAFNTQAIADRHVLEKKIGELTALNRQRWLAACAVLYLILFTVFCVVRFFRFRQNSRAPCAPAFVNFQQRSGFRQAVRTGSRAI
jgi:hypothetical protein